MSHSSVRTERRSWTRRYRIGGGVVLVIALVALATFVRRAPASSGIDPDPTLRVVANLEARTLYVKRGDSIVASYPVAIGSEKYPTPRGRYSIRKIIWNPAWVPPDREWAKDKEPQPPGARANPMKLVKIFFRDPAYYIHGTGDVESLGDAASHGCLRMDPDDAYRVARYLMENGGQPREEAWYQRILHFRRETKTVYLDYPIPMVVQ